jgi:hypothetical protein
VPFQHGADAGDIDDIGTDTDDGREIVLLVHGQAPYFSRRPA